MGESSGFASAVTQPASHLPKLLLHRQHLVDDFVGQQVASEAALAGRAEGAAHGAANLGADTHGEALAVGIVSGDAHLLKVERKREEREGTRAGAVSRTVGENGMKTEAGEGGLEVENGRRGSSRILWRFALLSLCPPTK